MEDVALDDPKPQAPAKKRGMFSRVMANSDSHSERPPSQDGATRAPWHHFTGRKRGQSGSGAELGSIPKREETPKPDSQLKHEESAQPDNTARTEETQATPGAQNTQTPEIKVDAALAR